MVLTQSLKAGALSAVRNWRGSVLLVVVNALLAGVVALVARAGFERVFGSSTMPEALMNGFDFETINQLGRFGGGFWPMVIALATWMVLVQMLAFAFIGGGVIASVAEAERVPRVGEVLKTGGVYAGRFLRILLIEAAMLAVVGGIAVFVYGIIIGQVYSSSLFETGVVRALYATSLVVIVPVGIVLSVGDYARVIAVARDEESSLRAVGRSFAFVFRNLLTVLALEVLIALAGLFLFVAFWQLSGSMPMTSGGMVFAVFVTQELFMFLRMGVKVWNYGAAMAFWEIRESQHDAVPVPPPSVLPVPAPQLPAPAAPPAVKAVRPTRTVRTAPTHRAARKRPSPPARRRSSR